MLSVQQTVISMKEMAAIDDQPAYLANIESAEKALGTVQSVLKSKMEVKKIVPYQPTLETNDIEKKAGEMCWIYKQLAEDTALIQDAKDALICATQLKVFYNTLQGGIDAEVDCLAKKLYAFNSLENQLTAYQKRFSNTSPDNVKTDRFCRNVLLSLTIRLSEDDEKTSLDETQMKKVAFSLKIPFETITGIFAQLKTNRTSMSLLYTEIDLALPAIQVAITTYRSSYRWFSFCCREKVRPGSWDETWNSLAWKRGENHLDHPLKFNGGFLLGIGIQPLQLESGIQSSQLEIGTQLPQLEIVALPSLLESGIQSPQLVVNVENPHQDPSGESNVE